MLIYIHSVLIFLRASLETVFVSYYAQSKL